MSQESYVSSKEGAAILGVDRQSFFYYAESRNIRRQEAKEGGKEQYKYNYQDLLSYRDEIQAKRKKRENQKKKKAATERTISIKENHSNPSGKTDWAIESDLQYIYAMDCDIYGIEYSVPPTKTIDWWRKNQTAIRVLFNAKNRRDIWGCITLLPMEEETIFDLLRGDLSEQQIKSEHILTYEPGKTYNCYISSCAIRPEKSNLFGLLLNSVLDYWIEHSEIHIKNLYGFASGASEDMSKENDGIRLVKKLFFSPRYDIDKNAWELNLNYYNPSPIIQKFQRQLKAKLKEQ